MNKREFWLKVAEEWRKKTDGIEVPDIGPISHIDDIEPDIITDDEIDDIFSQLGLDIDS